ncbi:MAG: hypothetical protein SF339_26505 [Blastocatellia bacterium]|nr:hypothetical protein [Blastocatellia bacterium]
MPFKDSSEPGDRSTGVADVLRSLLSHPVELLIRRWNWKAALLSACVRGSLWFLANLSAGVGAAVSAFLIEGAFYAAIAGFYGALIQAFRRAEPAWQATLTVMGLMPAINHTLEYMVHRLSGTEKVGAGIAASICFSLLSATFNLFAMRRGVLIIGAERQSLFADLRQMPRILLEFLLVIPRMLWRRGAAERSIVRDAGALPPNPDQT